MRRIWLFRTIQPIVLLDSFSLSASEYEKKVEKLKQVHNEIFKIYESIALREIQREKVDDILGDFENLHYMLATVINKLLIRRSEKDEEETKKEKVKMKKKKREDNIKK